jgi:hypothetical protein
MILRIALVLPVLLLTVQGIHAVSLRAGVSKVNITQDNPTVLVNDTLYARILILDDGKTGLVLISMDIINISLPALSEIRSRLEREIKINGSQVLINASHAHWTQNQVAADYPDRVVKAVKEAEKKMVPVIAGAGSGIEKRITMNRRLNLENGKEWTIRRATPEPRDEIIKGIADAFDPEIGILRLDRTDGKPLAVLFTFACHNYTGVPNRGVTAGFAGYATKLIEENLGNGSVALFFQGAAGDITPIVYKDANTPKQDEMHGILLGLSTVDAWQKIPLQKTGGISFIREELLLPQRTDIQKHIDSLEAKRTVILDYFKGHGCGALGGGTKLNFKAFIPLYIKYMMSPEYPSDYSYRYMQEEKIGINDMEMMDGDNKTDMLKYLNSIYKMEELIVTEANLTYLRNNNSSGPIKAEMSGLKIGEFVLITFSGELFARIGLNIKQVSPYENTFVAGYTNGSVGYAPTTDAYDGDGYEVSLSVLAPEWQRIFEDKAREIINKL